MKLSPAPHAHSLQSQFEARMMRNGWRLGALAISDDSYANPEVQSAWLRWQDNPFQSPEPFDNARWDNEDDGSAVVADWEDEE